jgi:pimeloyl-ACP methyl ester carboxylesterase
MRLAIVVVITISLSATDAKGQSNGGNAVDSNGVRIQYTDRGSGPGVLLMHGFQSSKAQWESALAPRLLQDGFRVIAYDARGHGASGKPQTAEQYGDENVKDAVRLLDHLGIKRVHIVGYSRGASIASRLVAEYPDRVQSIVFGG